MREIESFLIPMKNESEIIMRSASVMRMENGKSLYIRDFSTFIGAIAHAAPPTKSRFTMFEPTTFPKAIPSTYLIAEVRLTASSGRLVPKETIVRPITTDGILKIRAIAELPSTKKSAPLTSRTKPTTNKAI